MVVVAYVVIVVVVVKISKLEQNTWSFENRTSNSHYGHLFRLMSFGLNYIDVIVVVVAAVRLNFHIIFIESLQESIFLITNMRNEDPLSFVSMKCNSVGLLSRLS
jgi:hypothetical protein